MPTLRATHAFICVEVHIDGIRVARHGAFMRVDFDECHRDVLAACIEEHAFANSPLPGNCQVILKCTKIRDTVQGRPATDVGLDCSKFLNFYVLLP